MLDPEKRRALALNSHWSWYVMDDEKTAVIHASVQIPNDCGGQMPDVVAVVPDAATANRMCNDHNRTVDGGW
jgi:hypothetical protein